jgi:hypothetical protein
VPTQDNTAAGSAAANEFVEPEDLAALPEAHRRIIARWLAERGSLPEGGLFPQQAQGFNSGLRGAAVDLVAPLSEDSSVMHAREVLADRDRPGVDAAGEPTGVLHVGSGTYVDMTYYSAALDEIYRLRAALAHESQVRDEDLALKSYPAGRRHAAQSAVARMTAAAKGSCADAYPPHRFNRKEALTAVGADGCFTHYDWMQQVHRSERQPTEGRR